MLTFLFCFDVLVVVLVALPLWLYMVGADVLGLVDLLASVVGVDDVLGGVVFVLVGIVMVVAIGVVAVVVVLVLCVVCWCCHGACVCCSGVGDQVAGTVIDFCWCP